MPNERTAESLTAHLLVDLFHPWGLTVEEAIELAKRLDLGLLLEVALELAKRLKREVAQQTADYDSLRRELAEARTNQEAQRHSLAQEIHACLKSRGFFSPPRRITASDLIGAVGRALDSQTAYAEALKLAAQNVVNHRLDEAFIEGSDIHALDKALHPERHEGNTEPQESHYHGIEPPTF